VEVCNLGGTSSAAVVITDTLPVSTPLTNWMTIQQGWIEVTQMPGLLVVERPTVSGSSCSILELITHVPPDAMPGAQLCNVVAVATDNDVNIDNNVSMVCVNVAGAAPAIEIQKATNSHDADDPPGPVIPPGEPVAWTYVVTNTGNTTLTAVTVEDNQAGVTPDCQPFDLQPAETVVCTASGVAVAGQYENIGTVVGSPPVGDPVGDSDPSHYFGFFDVSLFADGFESSDTSAWSHTIP